MKLRILATISILSLAAFAFQVYAVTPSPSPSPKSSPRPTSTPTATSSAQQDTVNQNLKDRIEKAIEEKAQTVENTRKKRAIVGIVERVTSESLSLKTLQNTTETIKLVPNKTAMLQLPGLQPITLTDLELNSFVIVMGYADDGVLEARRILLSPASLFPVRKEVFFGKVSTVTTTEISLILRTQEQKILSLSKKVQFQKADGSKAVRADVSKSGEVFVVVPQVEDASSSATLVRILK